MDDEIIIDEENQVQEGSFDSEIASNASPLLKKNKPKSIHHTSSLAPVAQDHRSQNFESD